MLIFFIDKNYDKTGIFERKFNFDYEIEIRSKIYIES